MHAYATTFEPESFDDDGITRQRLYGTPATEAMRLSHGSNDGEDAITLVAQGEDR